MGDERGECTWGDSWSNAMGDGERDECVLERPSNRGDKGMCDPGGDGGEDYCRETDAGRRG